MDTKRCSRCRRQQPLDNFTREARSRDGRHSYCRTCRSGQRELDGHELLCARLIEEGMPEMAAAKLVVTWDQLARKAA
jgi:hypothetical protein